MRPTYKISLAEEMIKERLVRLVAVDRAGFAGDTLTLQLRADNLAIPRRGVTVDCEIGYVETGTWTLGTFVVEDVKLKGAPPVMTLLCISQPQGEASVSALQTTREERVWQEHAIAGTTFSTVVSAVCSEVGLTAKVDDRLADLPMPYTRQSKESDAAFLHRLTVERNGIVKMNGTEVIFQTRDAHRIGDVNIAYNTGMAYTFDFTERYNIESVRAKYQDDQAGEVRNITVGSGKGIKVITKVFADAESAQLAADALLKHYQRSFISGMVTLPTVPGLLAEKFVNLSGFPGGDVVNAQYVCVHAKHTYSKPTGLVSELSLKRPQSS